MKDEMHTSSSSERGSSHTSDAVVPKFGLGECIGIARRGFEAWAAKDHNRRWFRKIDGTPIPNDVAVNIAEAFADAFAAAPPQPAPVGLVDAGLVRAYLAAVDAYRGMSRGSGDYLEPMSLTRAINGHEAAIAAARATLDATLSAQAGAPAGVGDADEIANLDDENKWLLGLLEGRDAFIVEQGLWEKFVATLPPFAPSRARLAAQSGGNPAGVGSEELRGVLALLQEVKALGPSGITINESIGYDEACSRIEQKLLARLGTPNGSEG